MSRRNEHPLDDLVRRAVHVRDEDVAHSWSGSDAEQALLQEIIMTPHDPIGGAVAQRSHRPTEAPPAPVHQGQPAAQDRPSAPSGRTVRRAAFAGAVLAAVSVGVIALPSLSGGDQALASWTPEPDAVAVTERPEAAEACREEPYPAEYAAQLDTAEPVIAERRGVWTTVVLAGDNGFTALCITDESSPFFARGMIGSIGTPTGYVAPGPRELIATSLGYGITNNAELSLAAGYAGSDVSEVIYRSPTYGEVTATVSQGHFALWLPGREFEGASSNGVELEVTYRDGTTGSSRLTL